MKLRQFATTINAPAPKQEPKPKREAAPVKKASYEVKINDRGKVVDDDGNEVRQEPVPTPTPKPAPVEPDEIIAVELDRTSPTPDVLAWAQAHTTATTIDVVGENPPDLGWVWLTYSEKPERSELDMLKANGFRWASRRKQWAHPCGLFRPSSRDKVNPYQKYQSVAVKDED